VEGVLYFGVTFILSDICLSAIPRNLKR